MAAIFGEGCTVLELYALLARDGDKLLCIDSYQYKRTNLTRILDHLIRLTKKAFGGLKNALAKLDTSPYQLALNITQPNYSNMKEVTVDSLTVPT